MQISYKNNTVSDEYHCEKCLASNCKLWRLYQSGYKGLLCATCAAKDQNKNISNMGSDGTYKDPSDKYESAPTDQIGWYVPAVPDEEGVSFWGYSSVPEEGCDWWRNLPTFALPKLCDEGA